MATRQLSPSGYQKIMQAQAARQPHARPAPTGPSGTDRAFSTAKMGVGTLGSLAKGTALSPYAGGAQAGLSAAEAVRAFQAGKPFQGSLGLTQAAGGALRSIPALAQMKLPGGITGGQAGAGLGGLAGLASLGYGLSQGGEPTVQSATGALMSGVQGAQGVSQALGATQLAGALGGFGSIAGPVTGVVQGAGQILGARGERADLDRALGGVQMIGAAAAPFTFGLSALAAPLMQLIAEKGPRKGPWMDILSPGLSSLLPGAYGAKRKSASDIGYDALRGVGGGYAQAARTGDPAAALKALSAGGGDIKKVPGSSWESRIAPDETGSRRPVRSSIDPELGKSLGIPSEFSQMSIEDYKKMLKHFEETPITVAKGTELGGSGKGDIHGSGDVGYLDQQAAQQLAYTTAGGAADLIKSQLLQTGKGPRMDAVRKIVTAMHGSPAQIEQLRMNEPELYAMVKEKKFDPTFDPFASKDPLKEFLASEPGFRKRQTEEAAAAYAWANPQGGPPVQL